MSLRDTICHHGTSRSIMAYLSAVNDVRSTAQIAAYMDLMHFVSYESTCATLTGLVQSDAIERVRTGLYRRRWELV